MKLAASIILISSLVALHLHNARASSAAGQETLIGIIGRDYILLGADSSLSSSITLTSSNVDKIKVISNPFPFSSAEENENEMNGRNGNGNDQQVIAVAAAGDMADSERLVGSLAAQVTQMEYESVLGSDVKCIFDGARIRSKGSESGESGGENETGSHPFVSRNTFPCLDAKSVAFLARGQIAEGLRSRNRFNTCMLVAGMVPMMKKHGHEMEGGASSFSRRIQRQVEVQPVTTGNGEMKFPDESDDGNISDDLNVRTADDDDTNIESMLLEPNLFWLDEYGSLQQIEYGSHGLGSNFILSILDRRYSKSLSKEDGVRLLQECFEQLRTRYIINCPEPPCIKCIDRNGCYVVS